MIMPVYEGVLFQRIQFVYFHRILVHRHFDRLSSFLVIYSFMDICERICREMHTYVSDRDLYAF